MKNLLLYYFQVLDVKRKMNKLILNYKTSNAYKINIECNFNIL